MVALVRANMTMMAAQSFEQRRGADAPFRWHRQVPCIFMAMSFTLPLRKRPKNTASNEL